MGRASKTLAAVMICAALSGCSDDTHGGGPADAGRLDGGQDAGRLDGGDVETDTSDADAGDADATEPLDGGDAAEEVGSGDEVADCDYDGLSDREERALGTAVCDADSDGDGLSDLRELAEGTDPLAADTDGDGVDDAEEIDLGFDPTSEQSWADGVDDGDRWVVGACDDPSAEPVDLHNSGPVGDWQVALPPAFDNYTELAVDGADLSNRRAAAVFDDPTNEVAAALVSSTPPADQHTVEQMLAARHAAVESVGDIDQNFDGSGFDTHDYMRGVIGRYRVTTADARSITEMRDRVLFAIAPFARADVSGLPAAGGTAYTDFRVFVSVVSRTYDNGQRHAITSVAVAPSLAFDSREKVRFRMSDLINTTNLARPGDDTELRCSRETAKPPKPVEFYWVLDHSGSMHDDNARMAAVAGQFFERLNNSNLAYRLGVTYMRRDLAGRLRPQVGWHTDLATFLREVNWVIGLQGSIEAGMEVAREGLKYMLGLDGYRPAANQRIRQGADIITVWMTDDEEEYFQGHDITSTDGQQILNSYLSFFTRRTTAFGIIGGPHCGARDGVSYRHVVRATGGSTASICSGDMSETVNDIIDAASAQAGYHLSQTPISSTLRVFLDGQWVPRSRHDGFDYSASENAIAFFGRYRPQMTSSDEPDEHLAITYKAFQPHQKPATPAD